MINKDNCNSNLIDQSAMEIASEHGIDVDFVLPPDRIQRLEQLREVLDRKNVPFPISQEIAERYYQLATTSPFGIGTLTNKTVDLGGFENSQTYESLTFEDHLSWACLIADQHKSKQHYACDEYLSGEQTFEIGANVIPDYYLLNARIFQQTGWQLATVSEIIPAEIFFHCHSHKFFPVTTFMRPIGTDYLEEPDIGHDIAGHVATFTIPEVALVMNNHGLANNLIRQEKEQKLRKATSDEEISKIETEATELLLYAGRLYWFTVEFGLVMQNGKLKAFGAGILSSPGETRFSIDAPESNRILIDPSDDKDLLRLATTDYLISEFQKTYFVMKDFDTLTSLTPERILSVVRTAKNLPHHTWREIVPGDDVINVGKAVASPNEKYFRLLANQPLDDCLYRTAVRNLRIFTKGAKPDSDVEKAFLESLPPIPDNLIEQFGTRDRRDEFRI